jgi:hypothetical protein
MLLELCLFQAWSLAFRPANTVFSERHPEITKMHLFLGQSILYKLD